VFKEDSAQIRPMRPGGSYFIYISKKHLLLWYFLQSLISSCGNLVLVVLLFLRRRQYCWFTHLNEEIVLGREVSLFIVPLVSV
jgi:hypothetical protein